MARTQAASANTGEGGGRASAVPFTLPTGHIEGDRNSRTTPVLDLFFDRRVPGIRGISCCLSKKWLGAQVVSFRFRFENVINNTTKGSQRESYTVDFYPFL